MSNLQNEHIHFSCFSSQVSGSKFYYLKNAAALLEMALIQYTMNKLTIK